MMNKLLMILAALLVITTSAVADESCTTDCPTGQVRVGFADGDAANCSCIPAGSGMVDPEIPEAGTPEEGHS